MFLASNEISERYTLMMRSVCELAHAYYYQGRLADALQLLDLGDHYLQFGEVQQADIVRFLLTYAELLIAHYSLTNQQEHRMHLILERARDLVEASQDKQAKASILFLTGQSLYYRNLLTGASDYIEARNSLQQALTLSKNINDTKGMTQAIFYIGLTYERYDGQADVAGTYYQQMLELAREHDHTWLHSEALRHLSALLIGKDNPLSLHYALESLRLREKIGFKRALPAALVQVSTVYREQGELEQALHYCQQAMRFSEEMNLRSYVMGILLVIGEIQHKQNKLRDARHSFEQAAAFAQELNLAYGITRANHLLQTLENR